MAVQEWTIIKLVGPAASDAADRFDRWWKARASGANDPFGFTADEWSPSIKREVSAYLSSLIEHRWGMPVAYFSQHVDLWTAAGGIIGRFAHEPEPMVWHDTGQLWCYRLPDAGKLVERHCPAVGPTQFSEGEWFSRRLVEAAEAYESLWPEAVLLLNRQAVCASPTDDGFKLAAAKLPTWLGPTTTGSPVAAADGHAGRSRFANRRRVGP